VALGSKADGSPARRSGCILLGTLTRRTRSDGMARVGIYDEIKRAFQDLVVPDG